MEIPNPEYSNKRDPEYPRDARVREAMDAFAREVQGDVPGRIADLERQLEDARGTADAAIALYAAAKAERNEKHHRARREYDELRAKLERLRQALHEIHRGDAQPHVIAREALNDDR